MSHTQSIYISLYIHRYVDYINILQIQILNYTLYINIIKHLLSITHILTYIIVRSKSYWTCPYPEQMD